MRFEPLRVRMAFALCTILLPLFSSGAAVAAEWSFEPFVGLREEYNDNVRFTALPHPGVWLSKVSPSLTLSSKTEVSEVSGFAQLSVNRYAGDPLVEDRNDKLFSLLTRFQSERNSWEMNGSYKQDSTSESERADTGVVHQTRTQRSLVSLSPSWVRSLTERSSFKLDYNYQDVKYDQHIQLNDYTNQQLGAALQYRWSELDELSVSANFAIADYAPVDNVYPDGYPLFNYGAGTYRQIPGTTGNGVDAITRKSKTRGAQVGLNHRFSETFLGRLSLGQRTVVATTSHVCNGDFARVSIYTRTYCTGGSLFYPLIAFADETSGNGYTFNASLEKTFDSAKVSGVVSRETNPSGTGLVETDKFGVSLSKDLSETVSGAVNAVVYRTKYISLVSPSSRYYTFEPKLNWRLSEWWKLDVGYRYARYEADGAATATKSNAVYLNLTYNWPKMAISR